MAEIQVDVAIVGGGPAGLGAALELRRLGVARVRTKASGMQRFDDSRARALANSAA